MSKSAKQSSIVLVDGCRIPFQKPGTGYRHFQVHDLARFVIRGMIDRNGIDPQKVDRVIMGNVIQNRNTGNVAREAALGAGLPVSVIAYTVAMSCLSSHMAITIAAEQILSGQADVIIAGGADSVSSHLARFPLKKYKPLPFVTEFSTGESMGMYADRLAALFGISREAQDAYTVRSHQSAVKAFEGHFPDEELIPVAGPPEFEPVLKDNGIRPDNTPARLAILKPLYDKKFGTVTAANGFHHADGAAAVLLMRESTAEDLGLAPKVRLKSWVYTAHDPKEEMLLGQAYAIPKLLDGIRMKANDIDVYELHEAFASQVLAVLEAMSSVNFAKDRLGKPKAAGPVPLKKLNTLGGSLALGHPFGATGARLVTTAANRLIREKGAYALVSSCAGGGQGHALLLESVAANAAPKTRKMARTSASKKAVSTAGTVRKSGKKPENKPQTK